ncbi:hypothetical protein [Arthrobacter sp. fls2-241-R2A-172]|uniref:hypothetical protein n=1 Tax=Arthrobacter sp. fls2-241-R2A-172 TaxID=3040325 RepID=UPI002551BD98|nr:hypothetical protein [Arthrobacter sp. fls2-241-R2A-172]
MRRFESGFGVRNVVDVEVWRVQVKLTSRAPLRTFLLRREPRLHAWLLESTIYYIVGSGVGVGV